MVGVSLENFQFDRILMRKEKLTISSMKDMLDKGIIQTIQRKQASQFSPDSDDNAETTGGDEPKVDPKLQNTGEGYEQAGISDFGMEAQQDLIRNQKDTAIPDRGAEPDTSNALEITVAEGVQDAFQSGGEPETTVTDPQDAASEPDVDEKLKIEKEAASLMQRFAELETLGQTIVDEMYKAAAASKAAPVPSADMGEAHKAAAASKAAPVPSADPVPAKQAPLFTQAQLLAAAAKMAAADSVSSDQLVRKETLSFVDRALYTADAVAYDLAQSRQKQASDDVIDPEAAAAMQAPAPMGGEGEPTPEEAQMLLDQSLAANGVDAGAIAPADDAALPPEGDVAAPEGGMDPAAEEQVMEMIAMIVETMEEQGVPQEETIAALEEIAAEQQMGVDQATGAIADEEAAKTGHYKFASFIKRPTQKTADQEKRAARVRGYMRDLVYGPGTDNFN